MNERAARAVMDFCKEAVELIDFHRGTYVDPSHSREPKVFFTENGEWELKEKPDFLGIITSEYFYRSLGSMKEAERASKILLEEGILRPPKMSDEEGQEIVDPTFDQMRPFLLDHILGVLLDYLEEIGTWDFGLFRECEFKEYYELYEKAWLNQPFPIKMVAPLVGFDSEVDRIGLNSGVVIERFSPPEKSKLCHPLQFYAGRSFSPIDIREIAKSKFKLVGYFQREDIEDSENCKRAISKAITSLRLLHEGGVGTFAAIEEIPPSSLQMRGGFLYKPMDDFRLSRSPDFPYKYILTPHEVENFSKIYHRLTTPETRNQLHDLDIGFRRFNQAYARENDEDKIIDLTIALESSLLFEVDSELSYRIAVRGAALLNKKRNPEETYEILRKLYDTRSKIVHRGQTLVQIANRGGTLSFQAKDFLQIVEQIARDVLTEYLLLLGPQDNLRTINKNLDKAIVQRL